MKIHAFARHQHYLDHIDAIWKHLPDGLRGWKHLDEGRKPMPLASEEDDIIMVGGSDDLFLKRRLIYVEHGAGQKYVDIDERRAVGYHGSTHPDNVIAYISPRQDVADSWNRPAFAAGAPICDPYPLFGEPGVIAIAFHWPAYRVCPEATNVLEHYRAALPRMIVNWRRQGLLVWGHHHPRFTKMEAQWAAWGVPVMPVDRIRDRAQVLIADNTSLAYEMSHLGRDVVSLNAPWFRRDVEHGLRFWSHIPGIEVDEPEQLEGLDLTNLQSWRAEPTEYAYGAALSHGQAGVRAAAWITQFVYSL